MKLFWPVQYSGIGAAFGYTTFAQKIAQAMMKKGVELTADPAESDIAMHMMPPYFFRLWKFKKNILFTMFEFDRIPSQWESLLDRADLIVVPCTDNKDLFSRATDTEIEICPGGVDSHQYRYIDRKMDDPFTFLFLGDDNERKGTAHVAQAWALWNERYPELSDKTNLVMKMTGHEKERKLTQITKNAYHDYRILPLTEEDTELPTIQALYQYAHCFLWPTMGEGWGLPLCEAMATGLPCIYTPYGGTNDTASADYAYPVEYEMRQIKIMNPFGGDLDPCLAPSPIIESIVSRMHEVYTNYDAALDKGRQASKIMREYYTWENAADKLIDIIERSVA